MIRPFSIAGTGCALVDYLYNPVDFNDPDFVRYLSKTSGDGGLTPGKLVFTEEFEKFCGEQYVHVRERITKNMDPVAVNIGGPSVVSLIHAAQMLYASDAVVSFYGSRGNDEAGAFIESRLSKTPLKVGHYKIVDRNTPFTDVLSDPGYDDGNGERIFINNIGAAWLLKPKDLDNSFFNSDIVVFGGTAIVPRIHAALGSLLKKAKQHGAITVVNTVYDFLSEKDNPAKPWKLGESNESYRYIDLLVVDMEEALRLSGAISAEAAMVFFRSVGVGSLAITHGSNPLHYFANNDLFGNIPPAILQVSERVRAELKQDGGRTGDTTGCGDNFTGGVLAAVANQLMKHPGRKVNLPLALALGVASGGFTCFYHGGTYYEEYAGQKQKIIGSYFRDYLVQEGMEEEV